MSRAAWAAVVVRSLRSATRAWATAPSSAIQATRTTITAQTTRTAGPPESRAASRKHDAFRNRAAQGRWLAPPPTFGSCGLCGWAGGGKKILNALCINALPGGVVLLRQRPQGRRAVRNLGRENVLGPEIHGRRTHHVHHRPRWQDQEDLCEGEPRGTRRQGAGGAQVIASGESGNTTARLR